MAVNLCFFRFYRLNSRSGSSFDSSKIWCVVSNEWFYKLREFIRSDFFSFFKVDIVEDYIFDFFDINGGIVDLLWFGFSRKKDIVIVVIFFGMVGRVLRGKNLDVDEMVVFIEF